MNEDTSPWIMAFLMGCAMICFGYAFYLLWRGEFLHGVIALGAGRGWLSD